MSDLSSLKRLRAEIAAGASFCGVDALFPAVRFTALICSLVVLALTAHAAPVPEVSAAEWGPYGKMVGKSWLGKRDKRNYRVTVEWQEPGTELVEKWIDLDARFANVARNITNTIQKGTRPGELAIKTLGGRCNRDGRIQSDGSLLLVCRTSLLKWPERLTSAGPDALELQTVKLEGDAVTQVVDSVKLTAEPSEAEKRQLIAAQAESINAADWGVYADLAGYSWATEQGGQQREVSIEWAIPGRELSERWIYKAADGSERSSINSSITRGEKAGELRMVSKMPRCSTRIGQIQSDGSILFTCSGLLKFPLQVVAPTPGVLEHRSVKLKNGVITRVSETITYAWGGVTDIDRAVEFYQQAADKGVPDAQARLGDLYDTGKGVPQDRPQAVRWYRKAAEQGDAYAQRKLGDAYTDGLGVAANQREAAIWFRKAADQGDIYAMNSLGFYYWKDNVAVADQWFRKAIAGGHPMARENLASLHGQVAADAEYREAMIGAITEGFSEGFTSEWSARKERMAQQAQQVAEWQAQADRQIEQQAQQRADEEARERAAEMERVHQLHERQEAERQQRAQQQAQQTSRVAPNAAEQSQQRQQEQQRRADEARRRAAADAERERQQQIETERRRQEEAAQRERAERAAQERSRQLEEALKRQEEEARNRPVAYPEG
ncbi:MAG: hypothetical protein WCZ87_01675, partial [Thiohalobacteraceae bacterium]